MSCCTTTYVSGRKLYAEEVHLAVDFAAKLQAGETIVSAVASVSKADDGSTTDLTLGSDSIDGTEVIIPASGGKCLTQIDDNLWQTVYYIQVLATTSSGEVMGGLIQLTVYDVIERA